MTTLQIADRTLDSTEIIPLLTQYQLIPRLIRELIIDQAIADIHCTAAEITDACAVLSQQLQLVTELEQQEWRSRHSLSQAEFEQMATRPLKIAQFKQATWGHQLESYFLHRKPQLDAVLFSLLRRDHQGVANELYFRILGGEQTFADLARQYSQGTEADTGGLFGPMELGSLSPELADLLYTSAVGVVQPPVRLGDYFVIVRVEKLILAQLDQSMRQRLLQEKFEQWLQEQMDLWGDRAS